MIYQKLLDIPKQTKDKNKIFIGKLKRGKIKKIDDIFHQKHEEVFENISEADTESFKISVDELLSTLEIEAGDICCYKLFFYLEGHDKKSEKMLKDPPRFSARGALEIGTNSTDQSENFE